MDPYTKILSKIIDNISGVILQNRQLGKKCMELDRLGVYPGSAAECLPSLTRLLTSLSLSSTSEKW